MNSHSAAPNTSDPYTQQYASTDASYLHSVVSLDNGHPRVDTSQHVATIVVAVADVAKLVDDPTLGEHYFHSHHRQAVGGEVAVRPFAGGAPQQQAVADTVLVVVVEALAVELPVEFAFAEAVGGP